MTPTLIFSPSLCLCKKVLAGKAQNARTAGNTAALHNCTLPVGQGLDAFGTSSSHFGGCFFYFPLSGANVIRVLIPNLKNFLQA